MCRWVTTTLSSLRTTTCDALIVPRDSIAAINPYASKGRQKLPLTVTSIGGYITAISIDTQNNQTDYKCKNKNTNLYIKALIVYFINKEHNKILIIVLLF